MVYNQWPKMGLDWVPDDIIDPYITPKWRNVFENPVLVQFDHRILAYSSVALVGALFMKGRPTYDVCCGLIRVVKLYLYKGARLSIW